MSMSQSSEFHKMSHATFGNPGGPSVSSGNRRHSGKLSSNAGSQNSRQSKKKGKMNAFSQSLLKTAEPAVNAKSKRNSISQSMLAPSRTGQSKNNSSNGEGNVNEHVLDTFKNADEDLMKLFTQKANEMPQLQKDEGFDGNATFINVGQKGHFPFDMDDPIFELSEPCEGAKKYLMLDKKNIKYPVKHCQVCNQLLQIPKKVDQCGFCACFGCLDCVYKQFLFPVLKEGNDRKSGKICVVCEWKLYLNSATQEISHKITKREAQLEAITRQQDEVEQIKTKVENQRTQLHETLGDLKQKNSENKEIMMDKVERKQSKCDSKQFDNEKISNKIQVRMEDKKERTITVLHLKQQIEELEQSNQMINDELDFKKADLEAIKSHMNVEKIRQKGNRASLQLEQEEHDGLRSSSKYLQNDQSIVNIGMKSPCLPRYSGPIGDDEDEMPQCLDVGEMNLGREDIDRNSILETKIGASQLGMSGDKRSNMNTSQGSNQNTKRDPKAGRGNIAKSTQKKNDKDSKACCDGGCIIF